ncbi:hypothetical protein [Streptomyces coryli]|uniref:hypothetical protein n=1 Tax=Streptomyces coryli TaxID=1128680 RepID=UPI0023F4922D|nr:hypothetical protein [Streptomyces coryli]
MSDYEFPEELLRAKKEWFALERQLDELPLRPWTDSEGVEHRTGRGWTPDTARQEMALRKRFRELSIEISIHPYWETLSGGTVAARMALREAALAEIAEGGEGRGGAGERPGPDEWAAAVPELAGPVLAGPVPAVAVPAVRAGNP